MIRITADLDNIAELTATIRTNLIIKWLYDTMNVIIESKEIRVSSSGKGIHIILWSSSKINNKQIFFIRSLLGDDYKRIERDKKSKHKQTLFYKKKFLNEDDRENIIVDLRKVKK